jgi:hypothetical protein
MNDDLHPDAVDEELRRRFDAGAPSGADPDAVLDAMRPRLQRARSRRRASFASAIAGVAVLVVVLAFVLGGNGGDSSVRVPPATKGPVTTAPTAPTTAPVGGAATPDSLPAPVDDHGSDDTTAVPDATPPTEPPPVTTAPTETSIFQASYTSDGGSITVDFVDGRVSLTSSSPAAAYGDEVHDNGPSRVEVRFNNGQTEWRIRVDVVNGQLVPEVSQH